MPTPAIPPPVHPCATQNRVGDHAMRQARRQGAKAVSYTHLGGGIGPNLGGLATRAGSTVAGQSAEEYITTSIVNPNAYIVPECPTGACAAGLMPQNFGQTLAPEELDGLVQYLLTLE